MVRSVLRININIWIKNDWTLKGINKILRINGVKWKESWNNSARLY